MSKNIFKDQISYYKARIGLLGLLAAAFLIGELIVGWREYRLSKQPVIQESEFMIEREKFSQVWEELKQRTIPVELEDKIRYGENIGKLEPFD